MVVAKHYYLRLLTRAVRVQISKNYSTRASVPVDSTECYVPPVDCSLNRGWKLTDVRPTTDDVRVACARRSFGVDVRDLGPLDGSL